MAYQFGQDYAANIQVIQNGLESCSSAMSRLARNSSFAKFWSTATTATDKETEAVERLKTALSNFKIDGNDNAAAEVVKEINSLTAFTSKDFVSGLSSQIDGFNDLVRQAFSQTSEYIQEVFSVENFKNVQELFASLEINGGNDFVKSVQSLAIRASEASDLATKLESANQELETLKQRLKDAGSGDTGALEKELEAAQQRITQLTAQISQLHKQSAELFSNFIQSGTGLNLKDIQENGNGDYKELLDYYSQIQKGTMSVTEAMAKARLNYSQLFTSNSGGNVDVSILQNMQTQLDTILTKAKEVSAAIANLPSNLKDVKLQANPSGTDGDVGNLERIVALLGEITNNGGGDQAKASLQGLLDVMKQLGAIGGIDTKNLTNMRVIFTELNELTNLNIDISQFATLRSGLEKLSGLSDLEKLRALSDINLSGLNNIKVSSTINSQLVPFLQSAATFDVDQINKLASINFSGLQALSSDNFKVSKASMENLKNLVTYNSQLDEKNAGLTGLSEQLQPAITSLQNWSTTFTDSFSTGLSGLSTQLQSIITMLQSGLTVSPDSLSAGLEAAKNAAGSAGATLTQTANDAQTAADAMQKTGDSANDAADKIAKFKSPSISNKSAVEEFESIDAQIEVFKSRMREFQSLNNASTFDFGTQVVDTSGIAGAIRELEQLKNTMGDASGLKANYGAYLQALQKVENELTIAKQKLTEFETAAKTSMGKQVSDDKLTKAYDTLGQKIEELETKRDKLTANAENSGVKDFDVSSMDTYINKLKQMQNLGSKEAFGKQFSDYTTAISQANAELDTLDAKLDLAKSKIKADDAAPTGKQLTTAWDTLGQKIDEYDAKLKKFNLDASNAGIENFDTSKLQGYVALLKQVQGYGKENFASNWASYSKYISQANAELTKLTAKLATAKSQKKADDIASGENTDVLASLTQSEEQANELHKVLSLLGSGDEFSGLLTQLKLVQQILADIKSELASGKLSAADASDLLGDANTSLFSVYESAEPFIEQASEQNAAIRKMYADTQKYIKSSSSKLESEITKQSTNKTYLSNKNMFGSWEQAVKTAQTSIDTLKAHLEDNPLYINTEEGRAELDTVRANMKAVKDTWNDACKAITNESNTVSFDTIVQKVQSFSEKWAATLEKKLPNTYKKLVDLQDKLNSHNITPQNASKSFSVIQTEASNAGITVETLGQKLQKVLGNRLSYMGTGMVFMKVRQLASTMLSNVRDIDAEMAQLQIVTGASDSQMTQFFDSASEAAQRLGASVTDVMSSIETFSRLGYDLQDSMNFAENATILSNVADTSVDEATTGLTSIVKGFGLEASDATQVSDELVAVGQEYAISASELMEAFENGGSSLSAAGNSLEESMAIFAAGNASVQDASTVGTAMKTMAARIRSSTAELDDMGEEYDSLVASASDYRAEIKALSGVDIMQDDSTYKSTYQILLEIAQVWDQLSDASQASLLEDLAGKRNTNVALSIITNLQDLTGAYDVASNAAGTAAEANAVYMDTIEAKIQQLKTAFQELSSDFLSSDLVKGVVSIVTKIVEAVDFLTTNIGAIGTTIAGIGLYKVGKGIIGTISDAKLSKKQSKTGIDAAANTADTVTEADDTAQIENNSAALAENTRQIEENNAAKQNNNVVTDENIVAEESASEASLERAASEAVEQTAVEGTITVNEGEIISDEGVVESEATASLYSTIRAGASKVAGTAKSAGMSIGSNIISGISKTLAFAGIAALIGSFIYTQVKKAQEKQLSKASETGETYSSKQDSFDELTQQAEAYQETIMSSASTETSVISAKQGLYEIQKQLAEQYGINVDLINDEANALTNMGDAIEASNAKEAKELYEENDEVYDKAIKKMQEVYQTAGDFGIVDDNVAQVIRNFAEEYSDNIDLIEDEQTGDIMFNLTGNVQEQYDTLSELHSRLTDVGDAADGAMDNIESMESSLKERIDKWSDYYDTAIQFKIVMDDSSFDIESNINKYQKELDNAIIDGSYSEMESAYNNLFGDAMMESINNLKDESVKNYFTQLLDDMQEAYEEYELKFDLKDKIDSDSNFAQTLSDAVNQFLDEDGKVDINLLDYMQIGGTDEAYGASEELLSVFSTLQQIALKMGFTTEDSTGTIVGDVAAMVRAYAGLGECELEVADESASTTEAQIASIEKLTDAVNILKDAYSTLGDAQSEMATNGKLSADTIEDIISQLSDTGWDSENEQSYLDSEGYDLSDFFTTENGNLELNTEMWKQYAKAKYEGLVADANAEAASIQEDMQGLDYSDYADRQTYNADEARIRELQGNISVYDGLIQELENESESMMSTFDSLSSQTETFTSIREAMETGGASASTVLGWIEEIPELAPYFDELVNGSANMSNILDSLMLEDYGVAIEDINTRIAELTGSETELTASEQTELETLYALREAYAELSGELFANNKYAAVVRNGIDDTTKSLEDYDDEIKTSNVKKEIKNLWNSDVFEDARSDLESTAEESQITSADILELAESNQYLAYLMDDTGVSATYLAQIFQDLSTSGSSAFENINADAIALDETLNQLSNKMPNVDAALKKYQDSYGSWDYDDQYEEYATAWNDWFEGAAGQDYDSYIDGDTAENIGEFGADFWRGVELFMGEGHGADDLDTLSTKMMQIGNWFNQDDNGLSFLSDVYDNIGTLKEQSNGLIDVWKNADGSFGWNIDTLTDNTGVEGVADSVELIAKQFGVTNEVVEACLQSLGMFGDYSEYTADQLQEVFGETSLGIKDANGNIVASEKEVRQQLENLGLESWQIDQVISDLSANENIQLFDVDNAETAAEYAEKVASSLSSGESKTVNAYDLYDTLKESGMSDEYISDNMSKIADSGEYKLTGFDSSKQLSSSDLDSISDSFTDLGARAQQAQEVINQRNGDDSVFNTQVDTVEQLNARLKATADLEKQALENGDTDLANAYKVQNQYLSSLQDSFSGNSITMYTADMSRAASELATNISNFQTTVSAYGADSAEGLAAKSQLESYINSLDSVPEEITTAFNIDTEGKTPEEIKQEVISAAEDEECNIKINTDTTTLLQNISDAASTISDTLSGGNVDITINGVDEATAQVDTLNESMTTLKGNSTASVTISISENSDAETSLSRVSRQVQNITNLGEAWGFTVTANTEEASGDLQGVIDQLEQINAGATATVTTNTTTTTVTPSSTTPTIQNQSCTMTVDADTSPAEAKIATLGSDVASTTVSEPVTIQAVMDQSGIDIGVAEADAKIKTLNQTVTVNMTVTGGDTSNLAQDETGTVTMTANTSGATSKLAALSSAIAEVTRSRVITITANVAAAISRVTTLINKIAQVKSKTVTITTNYETNGNGSNGGVNGTAHVLGTANTYGATHASGNAHADGTAYANGKWGKTNGGVSLIGELGPELVV